MQTTSLESNAFFVPLRTPATGITWQIHEPTPQPKTYVLVLATGLDDGGKRATLAFSAACSALAMDMPTHVFMVGDGSHWAYEGHADPVHQAGFPALTELMDAYVELGGNLYLCSACDQVCSVPMFDGAVLKRRAGVEIRGLVSILDYAAGGTTISF